MLVAAAMFAFTACDNTEDMSDEELTAAIVAHSESGFVGKTKSENKDYDDLWLSANFSADGTFVIYWGEKRKEVKKGEADIFWTGKWKVQDGKLLITDDDDTTEVWYDVWVISKEGKRITYSGEAWSVELD